jgi:hypothetical protein
MKKYLLPVLLILGLACSLSFAQVITRSIQLSQDPTGAIGFDNNLGAYFPGHIHSPGRPSALPALSSCGTTPSFTGSDTAMRLTTGSAATTCTITFGTAYIVAPACVITPQGAAVQPTYTVSNTAISMTVDVASTVYNIVCIGPG